MPQEAPTCKLFCAVSLHPAPRGLTRRGGTEVTVFPETKRIAVINNSESEQKTDLYIKGKLIRELTLAPREMRWVDDTE